MTKLTERGWAVKIQREDGSEFFANGAEFAVLRNDALLYRNKFSEHFPRRRIKVVRVKVVQE